MVAVKSRRIWYLCLPYTWWPAAILCSCPPCWTLMKSLAVVRLKVHYGVDYNGEKHKITNLKLYYVVVYFHIEHIFVIISESLVSLLLCLVKKCPAVCNISHFVVLLGAYGATLSTSGKTGILSTLGFVCLLSFIPFTSCVVLQIRSCYCFFRNMKETMSVCWNSSKLCSCL